jgi:uncharacterized caspase-like protein
MRRLLAFVALILVLSLGVVSRPNAEPTEKRIALVIGNAAYQTGALRTSANDAGLIAQTLQAAGFDVVGARDLDQESLRRALRDFLEKAASSGPDTVAFVYLSGYGLQLEGENYFLPVDAKIGRAADIAAEAIRISDYTQPLAALKLKADIFVLDAARKNPFAISGEPLAGGLALVEPGPGMSVAFNAAPGTIAPEQTGPYGAYAQALAEMMREGGLSLGDLFERVRLRVSDVTKGAQIPWNASRAEASFVFFERSPDAPAPIAQGGPNPDLRSRPLAELAATDAYPAALARDTLQGYEEFLAAYPDDPMALRVRAIIAARREATTWRQTCLAGTAEAYWSYLRRYPHGPHAADAHRRLALRAFEPPPSFVEIDYDVAPPAQEEEVYVERPAFVFDDPELGFAPPPPPPIYFLPPPPPEFIVLLPPPPLIEAFVLPIPVFVPIPVWCHLPHHVARPPENVIFNNIHNTVIIDPSRRTATIKDHHGTIVSSAAAAGVGLALAPALPRSIAERAAFAHAHSSPSDITRTASPRRPSNEPLGRPLPGSQGHPLLPPVPTLSGRGSTSPHPAAPATAHAPSPLSAFAHGGPVSQPSERTSKPPLGQALPGLNGHPLPPVPGAPHAAPAGRGSAALSAPVNTSRIPASAHAHAPLPATAPNPSARPARPQPPQLAARPPVRSPATPLVSMPSTARTLPPSMTTPHRAPPPPVQALRSPPPAVHAPLPAQIARPAPAPAFRPPSPPVVHAAPPPVFHAAPPPVFHAAPAPVFRAAPAPMVRAAPPPVFHAAPAPAFHAAPAPVARAAPAPPPFAHRR